MLTARVRVDSERAHLEKEQLQQLRLGKKRTKLRVHAAPETKEHHGKFGAGGGWSSPGKSLEFALVVMRKALFSRIDVGC